MPLLNSKLYIHTVQPEMSWFIPTWGTINVQIFCVYCSLTKINLIKNIMEHTHLINFSLSLHDAKTLFLADCHNLQYNWTHHQRVIKKDGTNLHNLLSFSLESVRRQRNMYSTVGLVSNVYALHCPVQLVVEWAIFQLFQCFVYG